MKRLQSGGNIPSRKEVIIGLDAPDDAAVVEGVGREYATVCVEGVEGGSGVVVGW